MSCEQRRYTKSSLIAATRCIRKDMSTLQMMANAGRLNADQLRIAQWFCEHLASDCTEFFNGLAVEAEMSEVEG